MASTNMDEFVLNFDLNHLSNEGNVQTVEQKYEKLRKSTCWLKSRILSTDLAIQKYRSKAEDYQQAVKAHSDTRDELKQLCVNFKDISEKCTVLEDEKKILLANQEVLQQRAIDSENKYSGLISHTNQLQMLVKELETAKEALTLEKQLDKQNDKKIMLLQKEKRAMLSDIIALKDVVLGKKKKCKRHVLLLKKYINLCEDLEASSSDESDNGVKSYCDTSSFRKLCKTENQACKNLILNSEQNDIAHYSDSSNGEVSVDTGRGSSRANSHDSPDYLSTPDLTLKFITKQVDAANSPITVYPPISVATSPIIFEDSELLSEEALITENLFGDAGDTEYSECFDHTEYIIRDISVCEDISIIQEKQFVDTGTSPLPMPPDLCDYIETRAINEFESSRKSLCIDPEAFIVSDKDLITDPKCLCEKPVISMTKDKKVIDACTSPAYKMNILCEYVDTGTNTSDTNESLRHIFDKSIFTESFTSTEKQFDEVCTSPISELSETLRTTNSFYESQNMMRVPQDMVNEPPTIITDQLLPSPNEKPVKYRNFESRPKEDEKIREILLTNNSSQKVCYEHNNDDDEVQDILNVMKIHYELVSPIPKTPCNCEQLKPNENEKLTNMSRVLAEICKIVDQYRSAGIHSSTTIQPTELDKQISFPESIRRNENYEQRQNSNIITNEITENDCMITENTCNVRTNFTCKDNVYFKKPNLPMHSGSKAKERPSCSVAEENIIIDKDRENDKEKYNSQPEQNISSDSESCDVFENDIISIHPDKIDTLNSNESYSGTPKEKKLKVKRKNKSKLQTFKSKLLPSCKIKKIAPSISKRVPKTRKIIPNNSKSSPPLNPKEAYEKAVKVIAELKLNEKKIVKNMISLQHNTNKVESPSEIESYECKIISTRSRTKSVTTKKEANLSHSKLILFEEDTIDSEKSLVTRKLRKRPAGTEDEHIVSSCKRILRSSSACQATSNTESAKIRRINSADAETIRNNKKAKHVKREEHLESTSFMSPENDHSKVYVATEVNKNTVITDNVSEEDNRFTKTDLSSSKKLVKELRQYSMSTHVMSEILPESSNPETKQTILQKSDSTILMQTVNHKMNQTSELSTESQNTSVTLQENRPDITNCSFSENSDAIENLNQKNCSPKINTNLQELKQNKRLRKSSSDNKQNLVTISKQDVAKSLNPGVIEAASIVCKKNLIVEVTPLPIDVINNQKGNVISYSDLELYINEPQKGTLPDEPSAVSQIRKENVLCAALDRYGVISVKHVAKKVPDSITLVICQKIEEMTAEIIAAPNLESQKSKMGDLVRCLQNYKTKHILSGLLKYLKDPTRKNELFNKINNGAAPPMTKSEMILLYVIEQLNVLLPSGDFVIRLWNNIEYTLFQLNRTPSFDVIESMSHFYAVMCRYFKNKSRLRCFMLDAMYCLQFKAVPLIRQCLDVCTRVLPFAHEPMAKTLLVTCLVYLLHFYKCQDKFNRAQDIRNILYRKYSYRFSEWNETMILEIIRKAIMDLRGTHNDKKMLRVALIILCKRHGIKWCETNIIQNILLPIIEKQDVPERIKQFCVLMLGPLLKPFPADRKAKCEVVINQLLQMLKQTTSHEMKEAIYSSLIFMDKHDPERVVQALLSWNPKNISPEFEGILNDYVMEKPLVVWKKLVSRKPS